MCPFKMINKPCVKCGQPSLEVEFGQFIIPYNGCPRNICSGCWSNLTSEQQEEERNNRGIRVDYDGVFWFGKHKLEDIIDKCNKVMELEARINFLEENAFSDRATIGLLVNKIESLTK